MTLNIRSICLLAAIVQFLPFSAPSARAAERRRIGLFHGKRIEDRERRAAQSGGTHRRPSFLSVRLEGQGHQSPQRTLRGGHRQRSRSVRSRAHHRCDAGGRARARFFRAHAGHGRARIAPAPGAQRPGKPRAARAFGNTLERFSATGREPLSRPGSAAAAKSHRGSILRPGRHGDRRAVAPSRKKAILQISIFDELGAQPDSAADQHRGDQEGEQIHRHAVAIIVAGLGALVFGEVVDRAVRLRHRRPPPAAARRRSARPEANDAATLVVRGYGIGFHVVAERIACTALSGRLLLVFST